MNDFSRAGETVSLHEEGVCDNNVKFVGVAEEMLEKENQARVENLSNKVGILNQVICQLSLSLSFMIMAAGPNYENKNLKC